MAVGDALPAQVQSSPRWPHPAHTIKCPYFPPT